MAGIVKSLLLGVCAVSLASCASVSDKVGGNNNSGLGQSLGTISGAQRSPDSMDVISRAAFWGTRYDRNPNDARTAITYSKALRDMGSNEDALKVMQRFAGTVGATPAVNVELGKVLIANERAFEAVRPLEKAIQQGENSWQAYSAYGVALDKIGQHRLAREQYDIALADSPGNAALLNNKGLSYALSGDIQQAELTLRQASVARDGTAKIRQNLALVLGFAGKTNEAERLARSDLPPRVAENNIAYYRALVARPAYWQEFTGDNVEMPDFGAETVDAPRASKMTPVYAEPLPPVTPAESGPATLQQQPTPQPKPQPEQPEEEDGDILSSLSDEDIQG